MTTTIKAHIAVLCTNLFFAINYGLIKFISPSLVGAFAVNILRVGLSIILFWILWLFEKTPAGIKRKDAGRFLLCGLTGIAINQMLFVKGLTLTSTIHAAMLVLVTPIAISFFALWLLHEQFNFYKASGLLLGIAGCILLVLQKENNEHAANHLLGDLLILFNAIFYAIYFILVKPLMKTYSPMHVMRWIFTIGFLMMLPFGWKETTAIQWNYFHWQQIAALGSVVVSGTFLAYYFNAYGLQNLGASVTGTYIYTQPFFTVVIATFILGEAFTWQKALSGFFIFSGVYLVGLRKKIS